jgi:hypothetical protein
VYLRTVRVAITRAMVVAGALAGCGGTPPPPPPPPVTPPAAVPDAAPAVDEAAQRAQIVAAHRKLEEQEQTALAAACTDPDVKANHQRCEPSCYAAAPADPRAGKVVRGSVEIQHLVCQHVDDGQPTGPFLVMDELEPKLQIRRAAAARPHKKGSWQADVEADLAADAIVITGGWHDTTHPLTHEKLRCVTASHYGTVRRALDACGSTGDVACEAGKNPAAHGLDVVHFRLAEATRLQAAGDTAGCQRAALEATAVARGLPRWRQYTELNVGKRPKSARYRTRFDGVLDEDTLFQVAATLGSAAETTYAACGNAAAQTTPEQEQSFHTCW